LPGRDDRCGCLSSNTSVATKGLRVPTTIFGAAGVTTRSTGVAADTVSVALAVKPVVVAVIVTVPAATPVARPRPPPPVTARSAARGLMLAIVPSEVVHDAALVTVCVVPSSSVTRAWNCCVPLTRIAVVRRVDYQAGRVGLRHA